MSKHETSISKELHRHRDVRVELPREGGYSFTCTCGHTEAKERFNVTKSEWLAEHQTESIGPVIAKIQREAAQNAITTTAKYAVDNMGMWDGHSTLVDLRTQTQYVDVATWLMSRARKV